MRSGIQANTRAVSIVIGAVLLVVIAVAVSVLIYAEVLPVPIPPPDPNVHVMGYVTETGFIALEHMGGETLYEYEIHVYQNQDTMVYKYDNDPWEIGESIYPPIDASEFSEDNPIRVIVYNYVSDGSRQIIFNGILTPRSLQDVNPTIENPMLVSSFRTNSKDEDLICYNYTINPTITPTTYIYNWLVDNGTGFSSYANLLLPFDVEESTTVKDYTTNRYDGTIQNAVWIENGKLGGAYSFSGNNYIAIPYCFSGTTIDELTVECWIKTTINSGSLINFDRNDYWELAISDGVVKWSTNASDGIRETKGSQVINDNQWHHVAVTYSANTGKAKIYIDGALDTSENAHLIGNTLGSGSTPTGYIARGFGQIERETIFSTSFETQQERDNWNEHGAAEEDDTWENLHYDDFESGFGSYTDGGWDCGLVSSYQHEGTYSACIQDDSDVYSSFYLTNPIDVDTPGYTSIRVDFWWMWNGLGWKGGEDWWLRYYNGTSWINVLDIDYPTYYSDDVWYHQIVYINETDYDFPTDMNLRFQCDASSNYDTVYFDQIYINMSGASRVEYDFDLRHASTVNPHTGTYSIGGSGEIDPIEAAFNRTGIDISTYKDVNLTLWYSYQDTEATDFFGVYYFYNAMWQPVFEVNSPDIGFGQSPWVEASVELPDDLDVLVLQFKWTTSTSTEYVVIDDLSITGIPRIGESNFSGMIDEIRIYNREVSAEQIYQNFVLQRDCTISKYIIVSEETTLGDSWKCIVTPSNKFEDDSTTESNTLTIVTYPGGD